MLARMNVLVFIGFSFVAMTEVELHSQFYTHNSGTRPGVPSRQLCSISFCATATTESLRSPPPQLDCGSKFSFRGSKDPGFGGSGPAPEDLEGEHWRLGHSEHGVSTDFSTGGLSI
jgi:hypothetical protein